ncbi:hypothetical protein OEZ85_007830 [Tetradesmus obliquus]|uniref:Uncharacterized protein n=1 Tax=Tetradesmus obliquus TaxID=3088 RepID=A0ABY8TJB3_TETOB|nr:hypothetical protein OEZ85_007830 [Tetradesmus obliquus]
MHCTHRPAGPALSRRTCVVHCSKGFGAAAPKQKAGKASKGTAKTPQQAADQALAGAAKSRPNVRPINPKEAARGKVDYVQVKDWADGNAADLGELQVLPDSYATAYTAPGSSGSSSSSSSAAGGSSAAAAAAAEGPFYQQLARHAQYLESQGALSVALQPGAKPFLPFD